MLFRADILEKIAHGELTIAFRYWRKPTVKAGGRLRTPIGELFIESVELCELQDISEQDVREAGFVERSELMAQLVQRADAKLYRIKFRFHQPDPRVRLREQDHLKPAQVEEIEKALVRLDRAGSNHPWTLPAMRLIADRPGILAKDIGIALKIEKDTVKRNIRKLKELGLTESLDRGYLISPRGRAFLKALKKKRK